GGETGPATAAAAGRPGPARGRRPPAARRDDRRSGRQEQGDLANDRGTAADRRLGGVAAGTGDGRETRRLRPPRPPAVAGFVSPHITGSAPPPACPPSEPPDGVGAGAGVGATWAASAAAASMAPFAAPTAAPVTIRA